jgi:DNA-binding response OmpR family regulator
MKTVDIIILEDDEDIALMIGLMLGSLNYKIKTFFNVSPFEDFIKTETPSLIVMDMLLSGAKGTFICEQLKMNENTKDIKVVMMSAHPDAAQLCLAAGADNFIQKPFDRNQMVSLVKNMMEQN